MRGKQHLAFGVITGVTTMAVAKEMGCGVDLELFVLSAGFGSLLPDIDTPTSTIGHFFLFRPISLLINKIFGHRTLTHDLFIMSLIAVGTTLRYPWLIGLWFGYFGHLFLDGLTTAGIPCLKRKIHFVPSWQRVYSGSEGAMGVTMITTLLYCCGSYVIYQLFA